MCLVICIFHISSLSFYSLLHDPGSLIQISKPTFFRSFKAIFCEASPYQSTGQNVSQYFSDSPFACISIKLSTTPSVARRRKWQQYPACVGGPIEIVELENEIILTKHKGNPPILKIENFTDYEIFFRHLLLNHIKFSIPFYIYVNINMYAYIFDIIDKQPSPSRGSVIFWTFSPSLRPFLATGRPALIIPEIKLLGFDGTALKTPGKFGQLLGRPAVTCQKLLSYMLIYIYNIHINKIYSIEYIWCIWYVGCIYVYIYMIWCI